MKPTPSAASDPPSALDTSDPSWLKMLNPYAGIRIIYPRYRSSFYYPSCHMMDYIVHNINKSLVDNFHFRRSSPDYHPYILRLYFGVLFWVQCLRAGNDVAAINVDHHQFLLNFLHRHPLETLPIPGPLLPLFKTLCSSQPEFSNYSKVYPRVPNFPGPKRRRNFLCEEQHAHFLPNVPAIFALLEHLNGLINGENPVYPKMHKHIPVTEDAIAAIVFGHHSFPPLADRSDHENWCLVSPGLQYYCEADQKLNESFAERYEDFDFPITAADDNLQTISRFLGMNNSMAWFNQVKAVAATAAAFFQESGTLADCAASGMVSNQIVVRIAAPEDPPLAPTHSADKRSLYEFSFQLKMTARNLPPPAVASAACAQTHIRIFENHPHYPGFGSKKDQDFGPFWCIRPIASSPIDYSSYLSIGSTVNKMIKSKKGSSS